MNEEVIEETIKKKDHTVIDSSFSDQLWNTLSDKYDKRFILEKEIHSSLLDTIKLRYMLFAVILTPIIIISLLVIPRLGTAPTLLEEMDGIVSEIDNTVTEMDSYITVYTSKNYSTESDFEFLLTSSQ